MTDALFFDIESRSANEIWDWSPREFFRLGLERGRLRP